MSRTKRNIVKDKYMRTPKTFQEIKDSEGCRVDKIPKRKKRAKRYIPTAYDDMPVSARKEIDFRPKPDMTSTCL